MTTRKPREFFIFESDYLRANAHCDLGDHCAVTIAQYPHRDDALRMFKVREVIDEPARRFTDTEKALAEKTILVAQLEEKLAIAVGAMTEFSKTYKADFHRETCCLTMGCHCSDNSLDEALAKIGELKNE